MTEELSIIAVILAAIDLEWTIRRTIDAAADETLSRKIVSGLSKYEEEWENVCVTLRDQNPLASLTKIVRDWDGLKTAYQIRHDVIHGRSGTTSLKYATPRVEVMLEASVNIALAGKLGGADPYKRLRRRRLYGPTKEKNTASPARAMSPPIEAVD